MAGEKKTQPTIKKKKKERALQTTGKQKLGNPSAAGVPSRKRFQELKKKEKTTEQNGPHQQSKKRTKLDKKEKQRIGLRTGEVGGARGIGERNNTRRKDDQYSPGGGNLLASLRSHVEICLRLAMFLKEPGGDRKS